MIRRNFIKRTLAAGTVLGSVSLAGCSTSADAPPRRSEVFGDTVVNDGNLRVELADDMWVTTREDEIEGDIDRSNSLSPVGIASAKGRGATGRGTGSFSSAPKTSRGRGIYGGGPYVGTWYRDHDDEIRRLSVVPAVVGIGYIGTNQAFQEQAPGPGEINWDETRQDVDSDADELVLENVVTQEGWYRVGTKVQPEQREIASNNLGWEAVDFRVEEQNGSLEITEEWVVSPRI